MDLSRGKRFRTKGRISRFVPARAGAVRHAAKEWSRYDYRSGESFSTNTIEGFWKLFKASVRSTHIHVSSKHMQAYLDEFTFRSNHRQMVNGMFDLLISRI